MDFNNDPHRRYNPLTGEWVKVSPHRTKRPWNGKLEAADVSENPHYDPACYLCPGNNRAGGVKNPDYAQTFVFENDFAALLPDSPLDTFNEGELFRAEGERGRCFVICFSPRHDLTLSRMDHDDVAKVVRMWRLQYEGFVDDPGIAHVQIFENRGDIMGCSNPHPHCQIWAESNVPDIPRNELSRQSDYFARHNSRMLLDYALAEKEKGERIVAKNRHFIAVVPWWAVWPYEILVLPLFPLSSLAELDDESTDSFALILSQVGIRYDNLFQTSFPYSMGIHQAPVDGSLHPGAQLHLHYYPPLLRSATVRKFMVGYEMLGMPQRDITAEQAALKLRELPNIHYRDR